jgi:hypothetical protein
MTHQDLAIAVLRAESAALTAQAQEESGNAADHIGKGNGPAGSISATAAIVLVRMARAKLVAADALEQGHPAPKLPLEGAPGHQHFHYDPKGRKPTNEA